VPARIESCNVVTGEVGLYPIKTRRPFPSIVSEYCVCIAGSIEKNTDSGNREKKKEAIAVTASPDQALVLGVVRGDHVAVVAVRAIALIGVVSHRGLLDSWGRIASRKREAF
jgi:hypothetical protein